MRGSLNTYMNMRSEARQVEIRYSCCSLVGCEVEMLHVPSLLKMLFLASISFTVKLWIFFSLKVLSPYGFKNRYNMDNSREFFFFQPIEVTMKFSFSTVLFISIRL